MYENPLLSFFLYFSTKYFAALGSFSATAVRNKQFICCCDGNNVNVKKEVTRFFSMWKAYCNHLSYLNNNENKKINNAMILGVSLRGFVGTVSSSMHCICVTISKETMATIEKNFWMRDPTVVFLKNYFDYRPHYYSVKMCKIKDFELFL